nr:hypothetical protein [Halobacterium salinarum]
MNDIVRDTIWLAEIGDEQFVGLVPMLNAEVLKEAVKTASVEYWGRDRTVQADQ